MEGAVWLRSILENQECKWNNRPGVWQDFLPYTWVVFLIKGIRIGLSNITELSGKG
jgi:hypothetical protein